MKALAVAFFALTLFDATSAGEARQDTFGKVISQGRHWGVCDGSHCTVAQLQPRQVDLTTKVFDHIYFILAGVMLWPIAFVLVWFLANRGYMRQLRRWIRWGVMRAHNRIKDWEVDKPSSVVTEPSSSSPSLQEVRRQIPSPPIPGPDEADACTPQADIDTADDDKSAWSWASTSGDLSRSHSVRDNEDSDAGQQPRRSRDRDEGRNWGVHLMMDESQLIAELDADLALQAVAAAERGACKDDAGLVFDYDASGSMFAFDDDEDTRRPRSTSLGIYHSANSSLHRDREAALAFVKGLKFKSPPRSPSSPSTNNNPRTTWVSRYRKDFDEICRLGKGGFGSVFRVRQRLDDREYAVKKVKLCSYDKENMRVTREAKNMAALSAHPNIVRYFGTWVETEGVPPCSAIANNSKMSDKMDKLSLNEADEDEDDETDEDDEDEDDEDEDEEERKCGVARNKKGAAKSGTWLYIQMELCNTNLRQWLDARDSHAKVKMEETHKFIKEIGEGLRFMHAEGFIHRDIKPDNIFIVSGVAKLGDFGLSCRTLAPSVDDIEWGDEQEDDDFEVEHTRGVGTGLYTAPELAKNGKYDEKVDMYSLGIVLFEILHPFGTRSERVHVLQAVRNALQTPSIALVSSLLCSSSSLSGEGIASLPSLTSPLLHSPKTALVASVSLSPSTSHPSPKRATESDGSAKKGSESGVAHTVGATGGVLGTGAIAQLPRELLTLACDYELETKLVLRLLSLDPRLRPSAIQVLESSFLQICVEETMRLQQLQIKLLQKQMEKMTARTSPKASPKRSTQEQVPGTRAAVDQCSKEGGEDDLFRLESSDIKDSACETEAVAVDDKCSGECKVIRTVAFKPASSVVATTAIDTVPLCVQSPHSNNRSPQGANEDSEDEDLWPPHRTSTLHQVSSKPTSNITLPALDQTSVEHAVRNVVRRDAVQINSGLGRQTDEVHVEAEEFMTSSSSALVHVGGSVVDRVDVAAHPGLFMRQDMLVPTITAEN